MPWIPLYTKFNSVPVKCQLFPSLSALVIKAMRKIKQSKLAERKRQWHISDNIALWKWKGENCPAQTLPDSTQPQQPQHSPVEMEEGELPSPDLS